MAWYPLQYLTERQVPTATQWSEPVHETLARIMPTWVERAQCAPPSTVTAMADWPLCGDTTKHTVGVGQSIPRRGIRRLVPLPHEIPPSLLLKTRPPSVSA